MLHPDLKLELVAPDASPIVQSHPDEGEVMIPSGQATPTLVKMEEDGGGASSPGDYFNMTDTERAACYTPIKEEVKEEPKHEPKEESPELINMTSNITSTSNMAVDQGQRTVTGAGNLRAMEKQLTDKEEGLNAREEGLKAREEELKAREEGLKAREEGLKAREEGLKAGEAELKSREAELAIKEKDLKVKEDTSKESQEETFPFADFLR